MKTYKLSGADIDETVDEIISFLGSVGVDKSLILRTRLAAEEILLNYQSHFGENGVFTLKTEKRMGSVNLILTVPGEQTDPFAYADEQSALLTHVMSDMGYLPIWHYEGGQNTVTFSVKRPQKIQSWVWVVGAAVLGVVFGLLAQLLPSGVRTSMTEVVLTPLSSTIMSFLSTVSVLMVFLSIISGICGMGNLATANRIGKRMLGRFALGLLAIAVITTTVIALLMPVSRGSGKAFDVRSLWEMLLNMVPTNILDAFLKGNTLQVIFLAAVVGIVALSLIRKMHELTEWTRQLNGLVQATVELVVKTLPVVVFISLFTLVATNQVKNLVAVYRFPLYQFLLMLGWIALMLVRTCITQKVHVVTLIKKLLPTAVITISTASSTAAFSTNLETCRKKLGVDSQIVDFGVPLSQSLYKPGVVVEDMIGVICIAQVFGVEFTWSMLIMLAITAVILSVAAPTIPGSAFSSFALLFVQCGIPASAISIVAALNAFTDRINTCASVMSDQLELVQLASSLGKLDKETLRKD